jgi:hypothetical protein
MPTTSRVAGFIQLTVAPVFLLSAVASILSLLTTRMGRIVDRARVLEDRLSATSEEASGPMLDELRSLDERLRLVQWALSLGVACAPLICLLIASGFLGLVLHARFAWAMASLFIATITVFTASLVFLLREVFLATATLRVGLPVRARARPLMARAPCAPPGGRARASHAP